MIFENITSLSVAAVVEENNWLEKLGIGGSVIIFGLIVVFIALVSLILITWLYPKISSALINRSADVNISKKQNVKISQAVSVSDAQPKEQVIVAQAADDTQLVAAITAAVAASLGTKPGDIVIRSIRRTPKSTPAWGTDSRMQQVFNKL